MTKNSSSYVGYCPRWYYCENLRNDPNVLKFYVIEHEPDMDDKHVHCHLYIEFKTRYEPFEVAERLCYVNPTTKKLEKTYWRKNENGSKLDDWLLYAIHYKPYLQSKGLERNTYYCPTDISGLDEDEFELDMNHALYDSDWAVQQSRLAYLKKLRNKSDYVYMYGLTTACQVNALARLERDEHIREEEDYGI